MIYGKLQLEEWQTARVEGEIPDSVFKSDNLHLFFYGTLYNRDRLQADPDDSNAKIATNTYLKDKPYGFRHLDGSYTIIYFSKDECGIVRDHHGTHYPIYYTNKGTFSTSWSDLATIHKDTSCMLNFESLAHFLQRGLLSKSLSVLCGIYRLEAGEICLKKGLEAIKAQSCYLSDYMEQKPFIDQDPAVDRYSRCYGELHQAAIRRRIGTSNRVGILLSGGYDSGANLVALRSIYDGPVDSYSIGFKGDNWTELPLARLMSKTFGTRHHKYEIDGSEITALPDIVNFLGEPFVEGGLMVNYCAMRLVGNDNLDVILGGDGSDQYFGTSGREVALHYLAARSGSRPLLKSIYSLINQELFDKDGKLYRVRFHLDKILHILQADCFGFPDFRMREMLQDSQIDFHSDFVPRINTHSFPELYAQHTFYSDMDISINRVILYKASRMASMFGNNLVFPYMDTDLYQFLQKLPINLKCKGDSVFDIARGRFTAKFLLKHHYKPLLPPEITSKKKQGGFAPMPLFFRDPRQRSRLKDFILSSAVTDSFLKHDAVERFLTRYDQESTSDGSWFWYRQNFALQYFNLLTLAVWWEKFVEKKEVVLK